MKPSILYYFKKEWKSLTIVTITGLIYNFGLILEPYFEGKLTQSIYDYFQQSISFQTIVKIVLLYFFPSVLFRFLVSISVTMYASSQIIQTNALNRKSTKTFFMHHDYKSSRNRQVPCLQKLSLMLMTAVKVFVNSQQNYLIHVSH